jgi:hypothetical protein
MNSKRRTLIICLLLSISIANYARIEDAQNIRAIVFVAIFTIGALSGLLLREIAQAVKNKWFV